MGLSGGGSGQALNSQANAALSGIASNQAQMYKDVSPEYIKGLDFLSDYAGLGNFHPADYGSYAPGSNPSPQSNGNTQLGGYYNPPASQPGWNWNANGSSAASAPTGPPAPRFPGDNPGMIGYGKGSGPNLSGAGDPPLNQMGPNPYDPAFDSLPSHAGDPVKQPPFDRIPPGPIPVGNMQGKGEGDPVPQMPALGPSPYVPRAAAQTQQAQPPAQTQQMPGQPRPMSRQQQYIQSNPNLGTFNPGQSSMQNRQQMNANSGQNGGAMNAMGASPYLNNNNAMSGGVSNQQLGIFNDPADALRNAQAQDQINHQNYLMQQQYKQALGSRGLEDSSILAGGLGQMNQAAQQQYAGYRQNLAMNAGQEQANRVAQMMAALNGGMGMGQQAAGNYGSLAQSGFQQQQNQQQALAGLGNLFGTLYGYGMFG